MQRKEPVFKVSQDRGHPFETICNQLGTKHITTKPYRPQINGREKVFRKVIKNEFLYSNTFDSLKDLIYNLGNFLFEYNHLRRHGKFFIPLLLKNWKKLSNY